MLKIRLVLVFLGLALTSSAYVQAQTEPPAAPIPAQILAAKKVFISNMGVGADRNYNEFYAAVQSWGRYEIVTAPADADLVLEISNSSQLTGVGGTSQSGPISSIASWFKLTLVDPKTGIGLWTFKETIHPFAREKTGEKNMDTAMDKLVGDLKALTAQPVAASK